MYKEGKGSTKGYVQPKQRTEELTVRDEVYTNEEVKEVKKIMKKQVQKKVEVELGKHLRDTKIMNCMLLIVYFLKIFQVHTQKL